MTDLAEMKRIAEAAYKIWPDGLDRDSASDYGKFENAVTPAAVLEFIARLEKAEGRLEGKFGGINLEYAEENAKLEAENAKLREVVEAVKEARSFGPVLNIADRHEQNRLDGKVVVALAALDAKEGE